MSEIITDKLTGKTSAGDVTITSGSATMKLQEGICTGWLHIDMYNSNTEKGSVNISSSTDNGTGDTTATFTNNSASATDRLVLVHAQNSNNGNQASGANRGGMVCSQSNLTNATSTIRAVSFYGSSGGSDAGAYDIEGLHISKFSELA